MATCSKCGKQLSGNDHTYHGMANKIYCEECVQHLTKCACPGCNTYLEDDELFLSKNGFLCQKHWEDKYFVCDECGVVLPKVFAKKIRKTQKFICEDCFHDKYFKCDDCGNLHLNSEKKIIEFYEFRNQKIVKIKKELCNECITHYSTCPTCNKIVHKNNIIRINTKDTHTGQNIEFNGCILCASEKFEKCNDCGEYFSNVEKSYKNFAGENICEKCYFQHPYVIKNYSFKPRKPTFHTLNPKNDLKLFFGIENEIELTRPDNLNRDERIEFLTPIYHNKVRVFYDTFIAAGVEQIIPDFIYQKHDGSLNYGIELVSQPADLEFWLSMTDKITELFSFLKEKKCIGDEASTAGMHIHINKEKILPLHQRVFSAFIYKNKLNVEKIAGRKENSYTNYTNINRISEYELMNSDFHHNYGKYSAVNWLPSKTVELRCFQSTLIPEVFISNIEFAEASILFTAKRSIADILTENCWSEFCKFVESQKTRYEYLANHMNKKQVWVTA